MGNHQAQVEPPPLSSILYPNECAHIHTLHQANYQNSLSSHPIQTTPAGGLENLLTRAALLSLSCEGVPVPSLLKNFNQNFINYVATGSDVSLPLLVEILEASRSSSRMWEVLFRFATPQGRSKEELAYAPRSVSPQELTEIFTTAALLSGAGLSVANEKVSTSLVQSALTFARSTTSDARFTSRNRGEQEILNPALLHEWCIQHAPVLMHALLNYFSSGNLIPSIPASSIWPPFFDGLDDSALPSSPSILYATSLIQEIHSGTWNLLYSSSIHGQSLNRLCAKTEGYSFPSFLIIYTDCGAVIGAHTTVTWRSSTQYREDPNAFLFAILPEFIVKRASTASKSQFYMFRGGGHSNSPVGLGFGGVATQGGFRLFVNNDLESGTTRAIDNSFDKGSLLSSHDFRVLCLEVWGCGGERGMAALANHKERDAKDIEGRRKVNRQLLGGSDWTSGADRFLMQLAGRTNENTEGYVDAVKNSRDANKERERHMLDQANGHLNDNSEEFPIQLLINTASRCTLLDISTIPFRPFGGIYYQVAVASEHSVPPLQRLDTKEKSEESRSGRSHRRHRHHHHHHHSSTTDSFSATHSSHSHSHHHSHSHSHSSSHSHPHSHRSSRSPKGERERSERSRSKKRTKQILDEERYSLDSSSRRAHRSIPTSVASGISSSHSNPSLLTATQFVSPPSPHSTSTISPRSTDTSTSDSESSSSVTSSSTRANDDPSPLFVSKDQNRDSSSRSRAMRIPNTPSTSSLHSRSPSPTVSSHSSSSYLPSLSSSSSQLAPSLTSSQSIVPPSEALSAGAREFIQLEGERLHEFCTTERQTVVDDATHIFSQFDVEFRRVCKHLRKPNVLLTGATGAGKSSLINRLFGQNVAEVGSGVPITKHFTKYDSDQMRVVLYDSKGLEYGDDENYLETTADFLDEHKIGERGESRDAIHVIWYIVNSAHSRFEPFEEQLCRQLFSRAPLMFLLNKADISSEEDRNNFRQLIDGLNLPNCVGVFDTVARRSSPVNLSDPCPKCKSDDITLRKKSGMIKCMDCGYEWSAKGSDGLDDLIEATVHVLPEVVRDAFVSAQNVSFGAKENASRRIIVQCWSEFDRARTHSKLLRIVAKMMARLAIVWEFRQHGQQYGATMARDFVSTFSWKDRFNLLLHKRTNEQRLHTTALGILWNRCLRQLALRLLAAWAEGTNADVDSICSKKVDEIFALLNPDNLAAIESTILQSGLEALLDTETANAQTLFANDNAAAQAGISTSAPLPQNIRIKNDVSSDSS